MQGEDDDANSNTDKQSKTLAGALSKYSIIKKPRPYQWHAVGEYGKVKRATVRMMMEIEEVDLPSQDRSSPPTKRVSHRIRLRSKSGEAIDHFVDVAYDWYVNELRRLEDNGRHLYEVKTTASSEMTRKGSGDGGGDMGGGDATNGNGIVYTRYRLSEEKTFHSLFFRQKESLLKLVHHFQERTGKYAIAGYPHKLGILLHGMPGTGKTSLIKALAQYTGRSIINVPLGRITTNAELMSIFFDPRKLLHGERIPIKLDFKDVIFVLEDVDAATKIVLRRDGKQMAASSTTMAETDPSGWPLPKPLWHMLLESQEADCQELVKVLKEQSEELQKEAQQATAAMGVIQRMASLPGLSLIGSREVKDDPVLESIGEDALTTARKTMEDRGVVEEFLAKYAWSLLNILEQGASLDEAMVRRTIG